MPIEDGQLRVLSNCGIAGRGDLWGSLSAHWGQGGCLAAALPTQSHQPRAVRQGNLLHPEAGVLYAQRLQFRLR